MAEFAHADELQTFLGLTPEAADDDRLQMAVELASSAVQSYCRQRFEKVEGDEVTLSGTWERALYLPERPVLAVASVTVGTGAVAQTLDPAIYTCNRRGRLTWSPPQAYTDPGSAMAWAGPLVDVTVVYDHGYTEAEMRERLGDIYLATLRTAARLYELRAGEEQTEQVGAYSLTIDTALEMIEFESKTLSRYRVKTRSVSVEVG